MTYIYKMPLPILPNKEEFKMEYIPIKRKDRLHQGASISFYAENKFGKGIFALGIILSDKTIKSSEIGKPEEIKLMNRNFYQIKVFHTTTSLNPIIPLRFLRHFPSFNSNYGARPYNSNVLYSDGGLSYEIDTLTTLFPYSPYNTRVSLSEFEGETMYRSLFYSNREDGTVGLDFDGDWKIKLHCLRERSLHTMHYRKMIKKAKRCAVCGMLKPYLKNYFELHEKIEINFEKPYVPVAANNFITVCPNCHKMMHIEFEDQGAL